MSQESVRRLLHRVNNEDSHTKPFLPFIYMVPDILRNVNPDSFKPFLVSIGPLHREDKNVQAFEGKKVSYLINLMRRIINSPQEEILESCMKKAYTSMSKIKASYLWTKTFSDAEISEMMVMDACFILEFLIYFLQTVPYGESYSGKDHLQFLSIMHDLMLLENQIPLFFLDEIFQCTVSKIYSNFSLIQLIHPLLMNHNLFTTDLKMDNLSMSTTDHILSLLHQCYRPPINQSIRPPNNTKKDCTMTRSAVDLDMAGVNFNPNKDLTWVMGMEVKQYRFWRFFCFWSKATLTMPELKVTDQTEYILRNLIAYEQTSHTQTNYVTAYAVAMDKLVNTQDDVAMLVESRVLINLMGSNEEASNMINNICKNVPYDASLYEEEWDKLNEYCNGYWPKHIAWMRSTYFNNPWNIIALVAGIILFILQVVQTIFTIKSA